MNAKPAEKFEIADQDETKVIQAMNEVESEIREFVLKDVAYLRHPSAPTLETTPEAAAQNVNSLIQRVAGHSMSEIEKLIDELDQLRGFLQHEGERVQREITGYAQLSQSAMKSARAIADNMASWKKSNQSMKYESATTLNAELLHAE